MSSSSEIAPAIQQKYAEHSKLLAELAAVDYVTHAYKSNTARIAEIKQELKKKREGVTKLSKRTQSEFKDVQDLSRSVSRRLILRIKEGKEGLEKKKLKEEQEYLDAFQAENNEKMAIKTLEEELKIAEAANVDLKAKEDKRTQARARLDALYQDLFGGLTNDYPEEDAAEKAEKQAEAEFGKVQDKLNRESQVNSCLSKAEKSMKKVIERLNTAELICQKELAVGVTVVNIYDMKELKSAKRHAMEVEIFVQEARQMEPKVANIGRVSIPTQDDGTPIEVDHGGVQILRMVTAAGKECIRYSTKLETELDNSKARLKDISNLVVEKSMALSTKRSELEAIRKRIIEEIHHGVLPSPSHSRGPWVFGGPHDSGILGGGMPSTGAPGFPSFDNGSTSTIRSNFPAGGFRSNKGSGEEIEVASPPGQNSIPSFPNAPDFRFPVNTMAPTTPGFRGAAEMGVIASIAAISFPTASPQWALNPQAAALFLQSAEEADDLKTEDIIMPQAPGAAAHSSVPPPIPDTPSSPLYPTGPGPNEPIPAPAGPATGLKETEQLLYEGRGKFFKFAPDTNDPNWEKAGKGMFRMVLDKGTSLVRIVVNQDNGKTTDIDLTGDVRPLPSLGPNKDFVWNVVATANVAVRLASVEEAKKFQDAYERAQASPLTASPQSTTTPLPGGMSMPSIGMSSQASPFSMPMGPGDQAGAAPPYWPSGPTDGAQNDSSAAPQWPTSPGDVKMPQGPASKDTTEGLTVAIGALNVKNKTSTTASGSPQTKEGTKSSTAPSTAPAQT